MCRFFPVITVKPGQVYPPRLHHWIYYSKVEFIGSWRFQIHLYIAACVMCSEFTSQVVMKFLLAQFWKEVKDRPAQTLKCGFCGCVALSKSSSYIFVLQAFTSFVLDCKTTTCNYVLTTCYTIDLIAITLSSKINRQSQTGIKLSMHITFWYSDNLEHTFAVTLHKLSWEKFTILLLPP